MTSPGRTGGVSLPAWSAVAWRRTSRSIRIGAPAGAVCTGPDAAEPRPRPRALHVDYVRDADLEQIVRSDPVPAVRGLERAFGGERFETGSVPGAHHVARHDGRRGFGLPGVRADLGSRPEAAAAAERKPDQERDACRSEDHEGDRVGQSG